jgi:hypothetical protein
MVGPARYRSEHCARRAKSELSCHTFDRDQAKREARSFRLKHEPAPTVPDRDMLVRPLPAR